MGKDEESAPSPHPSLCEVREGFGWGEGPPQQRSDRRTVKVAVQLGLLPGKTNADKAQWAKDHGVAGIELGAWGGLEKLKREADEINGVVPISSVCGNADASGSGSFDFLDPD